jgi:predicted Zn-dependent protease
VTGRRAAGEPGRRDFVRALGLAAGPLVAGLGSAGCGSLGGLDVGALAQSVIQAAPSAKGAFTDLDEPQEIELGRAVTAAVGARYQLLRDPALTQYVALVGNAVAAHSDRPDLRYVFVVLDAPEVNAFAAPGGFVFVTRGTLATCRDEAMLAGVLGHEVGHVALRHHVATLKAQKRKELAVLGVGAAASQTAVAPAAQAIAAGADALSEQVILKGFSRGEEEEADTVGQVYAGRAGYDPAGLRDFLAALVARGGQDSATATFFSTHPGTAERRDAQTKRLASQPAGGRRNLERFGQAVRPS